MINLSWGGTAGEDLRALCLDSAAATEKFGGQAARHLRQILADLRACGNFAEFDTLGVATITTIDNKHKCIQVGDQVKLIITAGGAAQNLGPDEEINWESLSRIKIIDMERAE